MITIEKGNIKTFVKNNWKIGVLYLFLVFISLILLSRKVDYFVDELLTYNLANVRDLFDPENDVTFTPASEPFIESMASNGKFDLEHIWFQQANDTHPPLYYILVHAICCLFPNSVSVRYAGIVNVVFLLLTFWAFRKIIHLIVDDNIAVYLLSVMFVLTAGLLSMVTLLRMYVMSMFWITLFTYLVIRHIEKYDKKDFCLFFLVTLLGALTHYYCIAYTFFISVCVVIICAVEKRFKEITAYVISMCLAGVGSVLIFPAMLVHIFNDERGTESMENLAHADFFERFKTYFGLLDHELFGGKFGLVAFVLFFLAIVFVAQKRENEEVISKNKKLIVYRYICILIPSTCYFLLVAKSAPFFTERYISPIFALSLAGIMGIIYLAIKSIVGKPDTIRIVFAVLIAVTVFWGLKDYQWPYLYREREEALSAAENKGGLMSNAIVVYTSKWMINPHYLEISECGSSTFYKLSDYDSFAKRVDESLFGEKLALFLIGYVDDDFMSKFVEDHPEYSLVLDNGQWGYGHSYYFLKN